jgi:FKBP-type peptidyl-prolyl cis-trans isomerase FkpA
MSSAIRSTPYLVIITFIVALVAAACGGGDDSTPTSPSANVPYSQTDLRVGTGAEAVAGRSVMVNYTGWLYDTAAPDNKGRQFDTSLAAGRSPLLVLVGAGGVIAGFDRALVGMRVGGSRRVVIPPELGYGATGSQGGAVPPNTAIIFEIELLTVS